MGAGIGKAGLPASNPYNSSLIPTPETLLIKKIFTSINQFKAIGQRFFFNK